MVQNILYEMVTTYGFAGPHDKSVITICPESKVALTETLRGLCFRMKQLTNGRGVMADKSDSIRPVYPHLRTHWHVSPAYEKYTPNTTRYSLKTCKPKWPEPSWDNHLQYANFIARLNDRDQIHCIARYQKLP